MTAETPVFHVTVAFGHGYGRSFRRLDAALSFAEAQMQSLLSEHENLEHEDFDGIYCERDGLQQYWRFDYAGGAPAWIPLLDSADAFAARVGTFRQGVNLMLVPGGDSKDPEPDSREPGAEH